MVDPAQVSWRSVPYACKTARQVKCMACTVDVARACVSVWLAGLLTFANCPGAGFSVAFDPLDGSSIVDGSSNCMSIASSRNHMLLHVRTYVRGVCGCEGVPCLRLCLCCAPVCVGVKGCRVCVCGCAVHLCVSRRALARGGGSSCTCPHTPPLSHTRLSLWRGVLFWAAIVLCCAAVNMAVGTIVGVWPGDGLLNRTGSEQCMSFVAQYGPCVTVALALNDAATSSCERISMELTMLPGTWVVSVSKLHIAAKAKTFAPGNLRATAENSQYAILSDLYFSAACEKANAH